MPQPQILVIIASTRQGRFADTIVKWLAPILAARTDATYEFADLRDWKFPYIDEPDSTVKVETEYTADDPRSAWRDTVAGADGFIVITPEYNHGYPAVLKTAMDALYAPWKNKPMAFISYGGSAGGARAVEQLRQVAIELQMAPIRSAVVLASASRMFTIDGTTDNPMSAKAAVAMLDQLAWWTATLKAGRELTARFGQSK